VRGAGEIRSSGEPDEVEWNSSPYRLKPVTLIKGEAARQLCRDLLRLLEADLPDGVDIKVGGRGRNCSLSTVGLPPPTRTITPADREYARSARAREVDDGRDLQLVGGGSWTGSLAFGGFGAGIPFLSRRLAAKLAAIDALESLQRVVASAIHEPWPGPGFKVRAETVDDSVRLWFEDQDGNTRSVGTISVARR
jgi:hypothetical protein